jgi:P2 family phage major capsid protein
MRNQTKVLYKAMQAEMAESYSVPGGDVTENFEVSIPMETELNDAILESHDFLSKITMLGVTDSTGQALRLAINGILAGRTTGTRQGKKLGSPNGTKWTTQQTNFDVAIDYATLDSWARLGDLSEKYMPLVYSAIALDRITVGFYGTSAAETTDPVTNPLGQDVNIGWLELLRTGKPENYLTQGATLDQIKIGGTGDYKSVDGLANDLLQSIPVEHRTGKEVVIIGSGLVSYDSNKIYSSHGETPSEKNEIRLLAKSYGGMPAIEVPRFPVNGMVVTDLANLHLYFQEGKTRRSTKEESALSCVVDYMSSNDAYAIGNLKGIKAIHADNVVFVPDVIEPI